MQSMQAVNTHDLARLAKVALACGFVIDEVLDEIAVSTLGSADPEMLWSSEALARLYEVAMPLSSKAHFPFLLGEHFLFDRAPEVEAFFATCACVRQALCILDVLPYLIQPDTISWHDTDRGRLYLHVDLQSQGRLLSNPGYMETFIVVALRIVRQICPDLEGLEIAFRHRPLQPQAAYTQQFGVTPNFGACGNYLSLPLEVLDRPRRNTSPGLHAQSMLALESRLRRLQAQGGLAKTIIMMITQEPTLGLVEICQRLDMEQRSLQRRLQEINTTFNAVQAQARLLLARTMLVNRALSIDLIAFKLGFADRNGFTKAFSKIAGVSPSQFRKQLIG